MREPVYRKIVFWISNQRTWIDVVDADMYGVFAFLYRGYTCHFTSRFLLLRAYKSNNGIADGTTWIVSEYALDRALAEYRKINRAFRDKIKKSPDYIRPADAEEIIRLASGDAVRLNLISMPLNSNLNTFFYD